MFNRLNTTSRIGKNSPWMCKFLDTLGAFPRGFRNHLRSLVHVLESVGLTNEPSRGNGLPIAFFIPRRLEFHFATERAE